MHLNLDVILVTNRAIPSDKERSNNMRHANAQAIKLDLTYCPDQVQLCIPDDGQGFNPKTLIRGFGLMGMQQRADLIGVQFTLTTSPGVGTAILVELPN